MKLWKRNAIAAAIVLFVCGAVYLNWSYSQDTAAGKNLGEAALVGSQNDPLLEKQKEEEAAEEGAAGEEGAQTEEGAAAQEGADAESGTYFSTARLNRQQARDNALSLLQEAGQVLGMTKWQIFFKVTLLQMVKRIVPPMSNEVITLVKDTSLAKTISIMELIMTGESYMKSAGIVWPLFYTAVFYLAFVGILTLLFNYTERKLSYFR